MHTGRVWKPSVLTTFVCSSHPRPRLTETRLYSTIEPFSLPVMRYSSVLLKTLSIWNSSQMCPLYLQEIGYSYLYSFSRVPLFLSSNTSVLDVVLATTH